MENPAIDLIIRIKNGYMARKEVIESPYSRMREEILKKLTEIKFIKSYKITGDKPKKITIELLYENTVPVFSDVKVYSRPGSRYYVSYRNLKPVLSGYGFSFISTSKGILTNKEAKKQKLGGELLFSIW
ncbi:30S ribosomal protein S8 [Candidatus Roizmanbacteria bacterium CG_4_10_14_0_2_um_filter_36_35]|uniref:Small ribosomal subunit protein uS8 n=4 Tax=Candidatus Roizmaniibacteriota TaxID=1752723 RepID=A0A2M7BXI9_9BACT|nr:MAG: 30S ribosomal protein S8 [Candidatus Roizmanbacteria bacterium CG11_big_fil_rev_8_21_14_0_20_35_14]PIV11284.1 MAG: 30S ribosomal protein S8 [Candidatus Roizmanbacteria bacterium CG03_land_8_20_14_0_80_35_26]PIZ67403.1 MAG: 30S ribosomal protein S8 [Candidatus Roizmanbacteria bacterium CG_4_10_14_0_2_um_filter_36_35]PJC32963.1 MAG: 30S ribosomal protein S8 [Candidatus Roizmanbacteria bacterium CG_4_9_14_0_2_um_filter_36_12]PJC80470.1 MAG: 30S ribosomal protein S8 [Candidatus Roizmanbacte